MTQLFTRRQLIKASTAMIGAAGLGWSWHRTRQQTIRVAIIGCGMRGMQLARLVNESGWYNVRGQIVGVCDVDLARAQNAQSRFGRGVEATQDFRQLLSRDDIDAVFIATPDHWHVPCALEALKAGKHVYCEKPMTLTIAEGQRLVDAVEKSDRTFLVGTQQRSHRQFQRACELVRAGRLGQLKQIDISVPVNRAGGPFDPQPIPKTLDWDRWLGPAPFAEYCPERFGGFRFWYEYSGGSMTDWGAHNVDIAQWAMGMDHSGPVEVSAMASLPDIRNGYNTPPDFEAELKYANGVTVRVRPNPAESGILFEGDEGRIYVNRKRLTGQPVEELSRRPLPAGTETFGHARTSVFSSYNQSHVLHFFDCILGGCSPISDVASQHRSASACHLANIAIRLGKTVRWNPTTEEFLDDTQATALLDRPSRELIATSTNTGSVRN